MNAVKPANMATRGKTFEAGGGLVIFLRNKLANVLVPFDVFLGKM